MRQLKTTIALTLCFAGASLYAQTQVKMTFSGTGGASTIDLKQSGTSNTEEDVAGHGSLGQFTFRGIRAAGMVPGTSPTCPGLYFASVSGAGVFRFNDGSVLMVTLTDGGDCIDLVQNTGGCVLNFTITGGTGRFKNASGDLTYTESGVPVLSDALDNPVFFLETGKITGTISRIAAEPPQDEG
ncbi:MAG TPA: hypothetical protein VGL53_17910 [Bryobacteraceae bacterium]